MTHLTRIVLVTMIVGAAVGTAPVDAAGYVGVGVSNHGVSLGFGTSNWGIWGSSWNSGGVSIGFSATLAGYGEWVSVNGLGRVWRPWVASGWHPYTHGRWVWTSLGWTWVAYEPWGWAPHHYGNWAYSTIGWVWSPGYVYHPGNVIWVSSGMHVGWYPSGPRGWSHFNRGYHRGWRSGYASGHYDGYSQGYDDGWRDARYATWVPRSQVTAENVIHHAVGHEVATRGVARSRVTVMPASPTRSAVERDLGRPVPEARIVESKTTIDGRDVRIVRPEGQERTVQRHGGATVQRALAPVARERASSGETRPARSTAARVTSHQQVPGATSKKVETRRPINSHRDSSTPSATSRSTPIRTASSPSAGTNRQTRSVARSQPSSRPQRPTVTTNSHRSTRNPAAIPNVRVPSQTTPGSTSRVRSVVTSAGTKTKPGSARQRTTRKEPAAANRGNVERSKTHKEIEARSEKRRRPASSKD